MVNNPRVFCIGRNYAEHVKELGNALDGDCVVFMKPASSLVPANGVVLLPRGRGAVHHEAELVLRLDASGAVDAITLGLDLTLREVQAQLKKKGQPWELAKSFDGAAPIGLWQPYDGRDLQDLTFTLTVNGETRQRGHTKDMLYPCARILAILAQTWRPEAGDIIYTGTPAGVAALASGDRAVLEGPGLGRHEWSFA